MPDEDLDSFLDSKISQHDKLHFEVKLDVVLPPGKGLETYVVEAYFFIPSNLGVNGRSYPSADFYGDIQNYIRFKTPPLGLALLGDESYSHNPFKRLDRALSVLIPHARPAERELATIKAVHELKILGCVTRSYLRDRVHELMQGFTQANGSAPADDPREREAALLLEEIEGFLGRIRSLRPKLRAGGVPERVREAYHYVDEFTSMASENYLTLLLARLEGLHHPHAALKASLCRVIGAEQEHRRKAGYGSIAEAESDNEDFARRRSMLKKYVSSILYLDIAPVQTDTFRELIFSFAAGVAMAVSVVAMVAVQSRFAFNSMAFLFAAVLIYMLKDRIKDFLKRYFTDFLGGWLTDHSVRIIDPSTQRTIGRFREAVSFAPERSVPRDVRQAREPFMPEGESGKEVVLKYVKKVKLQPSSIFENHRRLKSLNDILRFSVARFLTKMDNPKNELLFWNPKKAALERMRVVRTYPVDVVFKLSADGPRGPEVHYERLRLVLDRKGIKRLETA